MDSTDRVRFVSALTACAEYYGKDLSDAVIGLYWQALDRFNLSAVEQALQRHMTDPDSGQYMPKIADIIRISEGSNADVSMIAWSKFDHAVRSVGPYQDVVFDDEIIHRVVQEMGGWIAFCQKNDQEWPFIAKEFQTRYRGFKLRGGADEYPPRLVGISNAANSMTGQPQQPPVLLGNEKKALAVLKGGTEGHFLSAKPLQSLLPSTIKTQQESVA